MPSFGGNVIFNFSTQKVEAGGILRPAGLHREFEKKEYKVSQIHLLLFIGSFHITPSRILTLCFNNFFLESTYISCEVVLGLEV